MKPRCKPNSRLMDGRAIRLLRGLANGSLLNLVLTGAVLSASGVGLNLGGLAYYAADISTLDQMKRASPWKTVCDPEVHPGCKEFAQGAGPGDTKEHGAIRFDVNGWPAGLPAADDAHVKYRYLSTMVLTHNGRAHPAGKYVVLYQGKGRLAYGWSGRKIDAESRPGRDVVEVSTDRDSGVLVTLKESDSADPVRNIQFVMPGGICEGEPLTTVKDSNACKGAERGKFLPFEAIMDKQPWSPNYLKDLQGFRALRFMDWGRTNDNELVRWSDRTRWESASWAGPNGAPVEAMLDLAAAVGADPWINLPYKADDDYAVQFARLAKSRLRVGSSLILEYANEPWNGIFKASGWMREQARLRWPAEAAKGINLYTLAANWYGMRTAQLCAIVKAEFGAQAHRVQCVLNTQAANPWNTKEVLECAYAAKAVGKPCGAMVDAVAIAPYFGNYINELDTSRPGIVEWYGAPDKGLARLFEEILGEGADGKPVKPPLLGRNQRSGQGGAVALARDWTRETMKVAAGFKLPVYAYEGGQHLVTYGRDKDPTYRQLIVQANRDPRMGRAYRRMLEDWRDNGGQVYMLFNHVGPQSEHGSWGLKERLEDNQAPKWRAVVDFRDEVPCWWPGCAR